MKNQNFLAGKYIFDQSSQYPGSIINQGSIIAAEHGLVALLGNGVSNEGFILASLGTVILASGSKFTMTFAGNELLSFTVDGNAVNHGVNNAGKIIADGGTVLVTANTASNILDNSINMTGAIEARSLSQHNGVIILSANGPVRVSGKLNVSGSNGAGKIKVLGNSIYIASSALLEANALEHGNGGTVIVLADAFTDYV